MPSDMSLQMLEDAQRNGFSVSKLRAPLENSQLDEIYDQAKGEVTSGLDRVTNIPIDMQTLLAGKFSLEIDHTSVVEVEDPRQVVDVLELHDPHEEPWLRLLLDVLAADDLAIILGEATKLMFLGQVELTAFDGSVESITGIEALPLHFRSLTSPHFALVRGGESFYAVIPSRSAPNSLGAFIIQAALDELVAGPISIVLVHEISNSFVLEIVEFVDPTDLSSCVATHVLRRHQQTSFIESDFEVAFPSVQANNVTRVIDLVKILAEGPQSPKEISPLLGVVPRQVAYYVDAARVLGLLSMSSFQDGSTAPVELSSSGVAVANGEPRLQAQIIVNAMLKYPLVKRAITEAMVSGDLSSSKALEIVSQFDPDKSPVTRQRRASTIRAWTKWAFLMHREFDIDINATEGAA